jgi:hypothetical protein
MPILHSRSPAAHARPRIATAGCRLAGRALVAGAMLMLAGCENTHFIDRKPPPAIEPAPVAAPQPAVPLPQTKPPVPVVVSRIITDERGRPLVIGLNREALIGQFGQPAAEREVSPARVMEFAYENCRLAAYLYFDTARNDFYALQYEVNGSVERNAAADRCLTRIARNAPRS